MLEIQKQEEFAWENIVTITMAEGLMKHLPMKTLWSEADGGGRWTEMTSLAENEAYELADRPKGRMAVGAIFLRKKEMERRVDSVQREISSKRIHISHISRYRLSRDICTCSSP